MSFNTSWGSSTRQDHLTFMNGGQQSNKPPTRQSSRQPNRTNPALTGSATVSYAIGAAGSPNHSPKKYSSALFQSQDQSGEISFASEESVRRHLALSQKHEARIEKPPEPTLASAKDTSVNIASAFNVAAITSTMPAPKPLSTGSSRSFRTKSQDRLPPPPAPNSRGHPPTASQEEEEESRGSASRFARALSPAAAGSALAGAVRAVSPGIVGAASTLVAAGSSLIPNPVQRLRAPGNQYSSFSTLGPSPGSTQRSNDTTEDFAEVEALANAISQADATNGTGPHGPSKRKSLGKRVDPDKAAYKPPESDEEDYGPEKDPSLRKGFKNRGPRQTAVHYQVPKDPKHPKKKRAGGSGTTAVDDSEDDSMSLAHQSRGSSSQHAPSRQASYQPQAVGDDTERRDQAEVEDDVEFDSRVEGRTFEDDGHDYDDAPSIEAPSGGVGAFFGLITNATVRLAARVVGLFILTIFNTISSIYELLITRPQAFVAKGFQGAKHISPLVFAIPVVLLALWFSVSGSSSVSSPVPSPPTPAPIGGRQGWLDMLPGWRKKPVYTIPDMPAGSLEELVDRLRLLEGAFGSLEHDHREAVDEYRKAFRQLEGETKEQDRLMARLLSLETKLEGETRRALLVEDSDRAEARKGVKELDHTISSVRNDIASLHALITQQTSTNKPLDAKAEARLRALETHFVEVSDRVNAIAATKPKDNVKHVSADGKDLTQVVTSIVAKDGVGMPDFALYYAGAVVEPRMTTKTFKFRSGWGKDTRGRPPVTAIVPDITIGNCWPFAGPKGQIGIRLSRIIHLTHVTIDHPPKDVLYDTGSVPRSFNVWIAVEGQDNIEAVRDYTTELDEKRKTGPAPPAPPTPFGLWNLFYVGTFEYDVDSGVSTQTFKIPDAIQNLRINTGAIVVDFTSNWGSQENTCIYRIRAHGTQA